jgi:hypothetical protein
MSGSDQKRTHGTSVPQGQSGPSAPTSLGINTGKPVPGRPTLVRQINRDGVDITIDSWAEVIKGLSVDRLEQILNMAKTDKAYDMTQFIRSIEYQGFDREFYVRHALSLMSVSVFCRFAIIGALRGSNFQKITETCDNMPSDLVSAFNQVGFVKTPKKRTDITILRNTACIPHWCVYWSINAKIAKKIPSIPCPAALQFPGAASLPMSKEVRISHLDFCQKFSTLLPGGKFNFNIYLTAYNNPIPVKDIPQEVLAILKVGADSESHRITDDEAAMYSSSVVRR